MQEIEADARPVVEPGAALGTHSAKGKRSMPTPAQFVPLALEGLLSNATAISSQRPASAWAISAAVLMTAPFD